MIRFRNFSQFKCRSAAAISALRATGADASHVPFVARRTCLYSFGVEYVWRTFGDRNPIGALGGFWRALVRGSAALRSLGPLAAPQTHLERFLASRGGRSGFCAPVDTDLEQVPAGSHDSSGSRRCRCMAAPVRTPVLILGPGLWLRGLYRVRSGWRGTLPIRHRGNHAEKTLWDGMSGTASPGVERKSQA